MSEPADARDGQLDQAEFKKKMLSQLATTGVVGQVKSQLRAQLLSQLQKGHIVQLGPPPGDRPGLKRHALNSMIADYMSAVQYNYSLSVFKEESGMESRPLLTEDELLDVLKIDRELSFYQSYMKAKAHGGSDSCFILNLLTAISEAAAAKGKESCTQTVGGDRYQLEVRMQQLDQEYQARLRSARVAPGAGLEERLALYRQEVEEQAAAEVARQVERIREMEVAAARLDEAAKARRAMEAERLELERLHGERLGKLRQREEEMLDKLRRQQRDVENVAYEHRQRILREEERLRNYKTEVEQQQDSRQEQLKQLERSLELRERAVAAREAAAEKKIAQATEAAAEAQVAARQDVEREYLELKSNLQHQRMQLEMDRSRIQELRSEATAEIAAARAKEERLRSLETARAEAEARAAAHAADAEVCRLQAEKLAMELSQARDELSRRLTQAADGADAMLQNAAGAMNMLNAEAAASRAAGSQIRDALSQVERAREEAAAAKAVAAQLEQERMALHAALAASGAEVEALRTQLGRVEALMDEAVAARGDAQSAAEESQFRVFQLERELVELRGVLARSREELAAARLQQVTAASTAARRPPSRGADSPGRRSLLLMSPTRRAAAGSASGTAASAVISALSALALGGNLNNAAAAAAAAAGSGSPGSRGHGNHYGWPGWYAQNGAGGGGSGSGGNAGGGGSSVVAAGTPALSNAESLTAAPRDATLDRLERLRRQEDIVASQEESYRKRMSSLQEMRERSVAISNQAGAGLTQQQLQPLHQQLLGDMLPDGSDAVPPYVTYVMHGSPTQGQPQGGRSVFSPPSATEADPHADWQQQQLMLSYQLHNQRQQEQEQEQRHQQQQQQQRQQQQLEDDRERNMQQQQQRQQRFADQQPSYYPYNDHAAPPPLPAAGMPSAPSSFHHSQGFGLGNALSEAPATLPQAARDASPFAQSRPPRISDVAPSSADLAPPPPPPPQEISYGIQDTGMRQGSSATGGASSTHISAAPLVSDPQLPQAAAAEPPYTRPFTPTPTPAITSGGDAGPSAAAAAAPPPPSSAPVVLPPPGLVLTTNLKPQTAAAPVSSMPAAPAEPTPVAAPDPSPPKPTIPGLVIVSGFTPRGPATSVGAAAPAAQARPVEVEEPDSPPPPPMDVQSVMEAKMRMLQEQRERTLAAQQQQQHHEQQQRPAGQRLLSRNSSRVSGTMHGHNGHVSGSPSAGGPGLQPRDDDSTNDVIAGEAYDTVAPELSTVQRRMSSVRRTSHEGAGSVSRQSSVNRRELTRGTSATIRSEASGFSVEAPGMGTSVNSGRAPSVNMTLDDLGSSMEGFVLPGLDEDDGMEAPNDDEHYDGAFAAEFSAGSVF
ncbi:hypothetical protein Agub_g10522 [Astrephomene gubernaculifera]|uniref:LisH domain-containing protein n=1 Tax=Astrephomene gubernaculifera TaxID=47775 RepID=A0AAD3DV71_9CHLO|nr:hypothetical protein Agub_g10522 [Astrephomene gubernaculifera]